MRTESIIFNEGVSFIIEELSMLMQKNAVIELWLTSLSPYREELINIMRTNNPDLYRIHVKPYIKEIKGYTKNV